MSKGKEVVHLSVVGAGEGTRVGTGAGAGKYKRVCEGRRGEALPTSPPHKRV